MPENAPNSVSVKVSKATYASLNDEQARIRKTTGEKPTLQELLDAAWSARMGQDGTAGEFHLRPAEKDLRAILDSGDERSISLASGLLKTLRANLRLPGHEGKE